MKKISLVIPIFNEYNNLNNLIEEISIHLKNFSYEIILVNDASTDKSKILLEELKEKYHTIILINNKKNIGQSLSIVKGVKTAKHSTIVTMDGDCQNNPFDIPRLLKLYDNHDDVYLVGGIRHNRKDTYVKKISSKLANKIRKFLLKDYCDDTGCSLKVFDKATFLKFPVFDGLHRFIPAFFSGYNKKTLFANVDHRHRKYGHSKYGTFKRLFKGIFDLIRVIIILKRLKNG